MANRWFNQFRLSLEKQVVDLWADVTFGSSGTPTLVTANSKGIASISHSSTGLYVVTLQNSYVRLLMVEARFINATAPAAPGMYITTSSVTSASAPTVTLQFNAAGSATDPGSGEELLLQFTLRNSTAY